MSSPAPRALPARPDLEFERKRAKKLLRDIRDGDADALAHVRASDRSLASVSPDQVQLADVQLTIAREYQFRSWPLLVRYFETFDRHQRSAIRLQYGPDFYEGWEETIIAEHRDRRQWTARLLGSFVPRFYGMTVDEIFASTITEEDARLVVAREYGFIDWNELLAKAAAGMKRYEYKGPDGPLPRMSRAAQDGDLPALKQIVAEHPELLKLGNEPLTHLGFIVARQHFRNQSPESRAMVEWVTSVGIDLQETLNIRLLGRTGWPMTTEDAKRLIEEGGDPAWIAPNGYSVLEHAIYRYWNGEAVDVIASRVKPRDSFWVAAGIGNVAMLRRHFDRNGKLTAEAREDRPDMMAINSHTDSSMPAADDHTILWDAAFAAAVNGRAEAFDFVLDRGFPIDFHFGMTLMSFAIGNSLVPMVELLISRGASLDVKGWRPHMTAREMAVSRHGDHPESEKGRRILELCGFDPDQVYREADAKRGPPEPIPHLVRIYGYAREDAVRRGQAEVDVDNFFAGLLREGDSMSLSPLANAGVDLSQLRSKYAGRLEPRTEQGPLMNIPNTKALNAAFQVAIDDSTRRRTGSVMPFQVMVAIIDAGETSVVDAIRSTGGDVAKVRELYDRFGRPLASPPQR